MPGAAVAVAGLGHVVAGPDEPADPRPYLRHPKNRKFMGLQDRMAVVAAGRALASAGLSGSLGERAGLFLVVGYIPFEASDADPLMQGSVVGGRLSMRAFSTTGVGAVNPLLTFRCLPNMPAYHVSAAFDLQGPYVVGYPGAAQLYLALDEALAALEEERVDVALVGGVAHQRNLLVEHHHARLDPPVPAVRLGDAAGFAVLERASRGRACGRLVSHELVYRPFDPLVESLPGRERLLADGRSLALPAELGAASLPVALALAAADGVRALRHELTSRDGYTAASEWVLQ